MSLNEYGWNAAWQRCWELSVPHDGQPARVLSILGGRALVATAGGEEHWHLRADAVVGDWAVGAGGVLHAILPRQSMLSRKAAGADREQPMAANIDRLWIVMGLDGDRNLRRLERYLVLAAACGARPAVVLNKADLCLHPEAERESVRRVAGDAPVVLLRALEDDVAAVLTCFVEPGETAALTGSSGAGKSTIVNRLRGDARQATQAVRGHDSRGRHTTTRRELLRMPQGWLLLDQPGLREVGLWAGVDAVDGAFADVQSLAAQCRFRDCRHQGEPGCAVAGHVDDARLHSFQKLRREAERLDRTPAAERAEKQRWKAIHRAAQRMYRDRGR